MSDAGAGALERYRALARRLDAEFRIPFTPIRFGWDAIIGLIPGIGDAAGGLLGGYGLLVGWRLGAPAGVLLRMLLNLVIDVGVGSLPLLGDLFDVAWRNNLRNVALLERWVQAPHRTERRSAALLWGLLAAVVLLATGAAAAALWFVVWLFHHLLPA